MADDPQWEEWQASSNPVHRMAVPIAKWTIGKEPFLAVPSGAEILGGDYDREEYESALKFLHGRGVLGRDRGFYFVAERM